MTRKPPESAAREVLVGTALTHIRTLAYRFQLPDPKVDTANGMHVLEQIRLLADAVDGLWSPDSDLAYRYGTANEWQRLWMRETLVSAGVEPPAFMTGTND